MIMELKRRLLVIVLALGLLGTVTGQVRILLEATAYTVTEEEGTLSICAFVSGGTLSSSVVVQLTTQSSTATSPADYVNVGEEYTFIPGEAVTQCSDIQINSDDIVESTETFFAGIQSLGQANVLIEIIDSSNLTLGLSQKEYSILEAVTLSVCVVLLSGETQREVPFQITTAGGSASASSDYAATTRNGSFPSGSVLSDESCFTLNIYHDKVVESTETFLVVLASSDSAVVITEDTATVNIQDNDGVEVAWQETEITIMEGNSGEIRQTDLCITLKDRAGGIQREVHFRLTSVAGSAENSDYVPLSVTVGFPADPSPLVGSVICQVITIIGDDVMEEDEMFTVVMTPINDFDTIVGPLSVNITIRNDEDVECPPLTNPENGMVMVDGVIEISTAIYSCNTGFNINGSHSRTCGPDGTWSGTEPSCQIVTCPSLTSPPNADVRHPIGTEYQSTALYTCDSGYERGSGDLARTCGADGTWSGSEPVCDPVDCGNPGNPRDLNGQVNFTTTTLGSKAQYNIVCSAGCDPVGNSTRTCTAEGIWSGTIPECQVISCGNLSNPSNGIIQFSNSTAGGVATYVCDAGYDVVGDGVRECQCNRQWSGSEATCQDVNECANSSLNNCHPNATCTNIEGSFTCTCNDGNAGNGVTCEEPVESGPMTSCSPGFWCPTVTVVITAAVAGGIVCFTVGLLLGVLCGACCHGKRKKTRPQTPEEYYEEIHPHRNADFVLQNNHAYSRTSSDYNYNDNDATSVAAL